jgi:hypothetical protein
MFSPHPHVLFDASIGLVFVYLGIGYAIFSFIVVVFVEAVIMKGYFHAIDEYPFSIQKRLKYSLIINTVSAIAGLPLANYILRYGLYHSPADYFRWMFFAFVFTVFLEFFTTIFLIKPKPLIKEAMSFTALSNLASYAFILVFPYIWEMLLIVFIYSSNKF